MADETKKEENKDIKAAKRSFTTLKMFLGVIGLPVIGFAVTQVWSTVSEYQKELEGLRVEIERLKTSQEQWATLAEVHKRQQEMEVPVAVVMWLLEHGKIAQVEGPKDIPLKVPKLESVDLMEFRKMQEQKYKSMIQTTQPAPKK